MEKQPLVSIITPCYNGGKFLRKYFDSIMSQTYSNMELIFINDGSTDDTEEIALSYKARLEEKGIKFTYIYQENAGQAVAVNRGLKLFNGDYLTWPDSDDWMPYDMIEKQVEYLSKHKEKGFVLNKCYYISDEDFTTVIRERTRENKDNGNIFRDLIMNRDVYWGAGAVMVRSTCFLEMNPTRSIFEGKSGQNWQMLLPISYKYECGFLDYPIYNILSRKGSHSRSFKTAGEMYEYISKNEETVLQTLVRIDMPDEERAAYNRLTKYEHAKKRFYLAVEFNDRDGIRSFYRDVRKYGAITMKLRVQYAIFKSKILSKIYTLLKKHED